MADPMSYIGMRSNSETETPGVAKVKTNKCKLVRSSKPLVNYKFYLDIEKHNVSFKIETKIRELGGSIEFFLTKEITHFITDRLSDKEVGGSSRSPYPPPPISSDVSSNTQNKNNAINNDIQGNAKIKSRADAMLHRARKEIIESIEKVQIQKSPIQLAQSWGTPIWRTDYALKYLEKVSVAVNERYLEHNIKNKIKINGNIKVLKGCYIKIEDCSQTFRPYYQILKDKWPTVNLNPEKGNSIFHISNDYIDSNKPGEKGLLQSENQLKEGSTMTKKNRSKVRVKQNSKLSSDKQCGFCEICRVEYDVLTIHLKTDEHLNFVKNDKNYLALDTLIRSSASVDKFLNINNIDSFEKKNCNLYSKKNSSGAIIKENQMTNNIYNDIKTKSLAEYHIEPVEKCYNNEDINIIRNTRQSHTRQCLNPTKPSPEKVQTTGFLRSRRESLKKINYAEPKEDEEISNEDFDDALKKRKLPGKGRTAKCRVLDSDSPKKPISTALLYKVVNKKQDQTELSIKSQEPRKAKSVEQVSPIIVKFKKIRQTELSILSGEAENFMFPKKISELSTDIEKQTTSESCSSSSEIISSDKLTIKRKSSANSNCGGAGILDNCIEVKNIPASDHREKENGGNMKRRKVNSENKSIRDSTVNTNLDCSSKLSTVATSGMCNITERSLAKSPTFLTAPTQPNGRKNSMRKKRNSTNNSNDDKQKSHENGKLKENSSGDGVGGNRIINLDEVLKKSTFTELKFAFERVPINEPWYDVFQRQDECREKIFEYYGSTVYRKLPYEMGRLPPLKPNCCKLNIHTDNNSQKKKKRGKKKSDNINLQENKNEDNISSSDTFSKTNDKKIIMMNNSELVQNGKEKVINNRASALINLEMPRKSPREHASTLAILSCLVQQKEEKILTDIPSNIDIQGSNSTDNTQESTSKNEQTTHREGGNLTICPQISENVKKMRRGETLLKKRIAEGREIPEITKRLSPKVRMKKRVKKSITEVNEKKYFSNVTDNYVNVKKLKRDIDEYMLRPRNGMDPLYEIENDMPYLPKETEIGFSHNLDLSDLIWIEEHPDNSKLKNSFYSATSRLRLYNLFSMNKKRKSNKTGWPKKKRAITRQQTFKANTSNGFSNIQVRCNYKKTPKEIKISPQSPITPPETDPEEKPDDNEIIINNGRNESTNLSYISASDKAEISDMFTVSSDSLDTLIEIKNQNKCDFAISKSSSSIVKLRDHSVKISKLTAQTANSSKCNLTSPIVEELIAGPKVKRKAHKTRFSGRKNNKSTTCDVISIPDSIDVNSSPIKDSKRTSVLSSPPSPPASEMANNSSSMFSLQFNNNNNNNNNNNDNDNQSSPGATTAKTTSSTTTTRTTPSTVTTIASNTTHRTSPQISPRKLRKPRGRWYRER